MMIEISYCDKCDNKKPLDFVVLPSFQGGYGTVPDTGFTGNQGRNVLRPSVPKHLTDSNEICASWQVWGSTAMTETDRNW